MTPDKERVENRVLECQSQINSLRSRLAFWTYELHAAQDWLMSNSQRSFDFSQNKEISA